jgi:hypothetical protein
MPMPILSDVERPAAEVDVGDKGSILDGLLVIILDIEAGFAVLILYNEMEFIPEPVEAVLGTDDVDTELIGPAEFVGDDIAELVGMALF